ncbi:MAG: heme ABC transporter permease [Roseovarius sp.]|nr:heme ABC transporter permease [Roseovarius sp.]MCY4290222.1 heme ABC transporter permease [Roseovarius sp.]MCY4315103.1 heme ABC transporter permease [Roseovarius sp.]
MNSLWQYANPRKFNDTADKILPWIAVLSTTCLFTGLTWGAFFTPPAERFQDSVKIIYLHVPSAMMAINAWLMMLAASLIWLVRRHYVSAMAARAAAPVGIVMTLIAMVTGAIWGQPTWGTWWAWDPRLTSFLILFMFYIGYVALWSAIENDDIAADLTSILCLVGSVFAVLSRYAVNFWNQGLHQGASLSLDREKNVADVYYTPLLLCIAGFALVFIALVLLRTRTEIHARRIRSLQLRERGDDNA